MKCLVVACALLVAVSAWSCEGVDFEDHQIFEEDFGRPVDSISSGCLGCHDGAIGQNVHYRVWEPGGPYNAVAGSHPIGQNYEMVALHKSDTFVSPDMLNSGIQLVNGRMSCISCHTGDTGRKKMFLVMENSGSQLCFSCHRK